MTIKTDSFVSDGTSVIYQTRMKYSLNTVTAKSISPTNDETILAVVELGENYIQLTQVPVSYRIEISYNILGTLPEDNQTEFDILERLRTLEKAVKDLYKIQEAQRETLNNRVNITAFRAWTKLIEKRVGIKLIDNDLGEISSELYKN